MNLGFHFRAGRLKPHEVEAAINEPAQTPAQQPMAAGKDIRIKPGEDQKKARRQLSRKQARQVTAVEWSTQRQQVQTYDSLSEVLTIHTATLRGYNLGVVEGPYLLTLSGGRFVWTVTPPFSEEDIASGRAETFEEAKAAAEAATPNTPVSTVPVDADQMSLFGTTRRSEKMSNHREAQILQAMAKATSAEEQRRLAGDLAALRSQRSASVAAERDTDLAGAVIRDHLTPVRVHEHHTASTDWISEVPDSLEVTAGKELDHAMLTQASLWFGRVSAEVKADREEFGEQAMGVARRTASGYGELAPQAERAFLDYVAFLHRRQAKPDSQSGHGESSITDYDTKADQDPLFAEDWPDAGELPEDQISSDRFDLESGGSGGVQVTNPNSRSSARQVTRRALKVKEMEGRAYEATCPNDDCEWQGTSFVRDDLFQGDDDEAECPECETPLVWANRTASRRSSARRGRRPFGRSTTAAEGQERAARVTSSDATLERVQQYMPSNYTATERDGTVWIHGRDSAGWTLDGYVIPRLASGLIFAEEVSSEGQGQTWATRKTAARPLHEIADEIRRDWGKVNFGAVPYLDAMRYLDKVTDMYGADDARGIVSYFLSNSSSWRGETAKRVKDELRSMLKGASKSGARSDYAHWNEDADRMWWEEEGKHVEEAPDPDDFYEREHGEALTADDDYDQGYDDALDGKPQESSASAAYEEGYNEGVQQLRAAEGSRRQAKNPQSGHGESDLDDVEVTDPQALQEMWPWEIEEEKAKESSRTAAGDIAIGGGDDWMDLSYADADADHPAQGGLGNVSSCRVCGKGVVLVPGDRGWDDATWHHVKAATASRLAAGPDDAWEQGWAQESGKPYSGQDAADVADVRTPGGEEGYPQPTDVARDGDTEPWDYPEGDHRRGSRTASDTSLNEFGQPFPPWVDDRLGGAVAAAVADLSSGNPTAQEVVARLGEAFAVSGGYQDSIDREHAFTMASSATGIDYNDIYDAWLDAPSGSVWRGGSKQAGRQGRQAGLEVLPAQGRTSDFAARVQAGLKALD